MDKMHRHGLLKPIIKRRHSLDINEDVTNKNSANDQILLNIDKCPSGYFEIVRYIYECFKDISQRSSAIEVICSEILKCLDPSNSKVRK